MEIITENIHTSEEDKLRFDNPIRLENTKIRALCEAKNELYKLLDEFKNLHPEASEDDVRVLKDMIDKSFLSRQLEYYLEYKLRGLSDYMNHSLEFCLNNGSKEFRDNNYSKLVYLKQSEKKLETNYV